MVIARLVMDFHCYSWPMISNTGSIMAWKWGWLMHWFWQIFIPRQDTLLGIMICHFFRVLNMPSSFLESISVARVLHNHPDLQIRVVRADLCTNHTGLTCKAAIVKNLGELSLRSNRVLMMYGAYSSGRWTTSVLSIIIYYPFLNFRRNLTCHQVRSINTTWFFLFSFFLCSFFLLLFFPPLFFTTSGGGHIIYNHRAVLFPSLENHLQSIA